MLRIEQKLVEVCSILTSEADRDNSGAQVESRTLNALGIRHSSGFSEACFDDGTSKGSLSLSL